MKKVHHFPSHTQHYLHSGMELKSVDAQGIFSGYASVFGVVDSHKDVILPGAFSDLSNPSKQASVAVLWQHQTHELIGSLLSIKEDAYGLYIRAKLHLEVQRAREAYALLKSGAVKGLSIGYIVKKSRPDHQRGVRLIEKLNLWEVSLVTFPSNEQAGVTQVKQRADIDACASVHYAISRALVALNYQAA